MGRRYYECRGVSLEIELVACALRLQRRYTIRRYAPRINERISYTNSSLRSSARRSPQAAKKKKPLLSRRPKTAVVKKGDSNSKKRAESDENALPNSASVLAERAEQLPPPPSDNAVITPAKIQGAETLMSLRNTASPDLSKKVSALSISQTLKNYSKSLEQLEKRVENPTSLEDTADSSSLKGNLKVENIMANISNPVTPPPVPSASPSSDNDLKIKLAKLEAMVESQRTYIEQHITTTVAGQHNGNVEAAANAKTNTHSTPVEPFQPSPHPPYPPTTTNTFYNENTMNILGFENSTSYLDLNNPEPLAPLETSSQIYEDIKRAREHAEYLAGEYSRKEGYLGGVLENAEEEEKEEEEVRPQNVVDISSLPLPNSPVPTPMPAHPFKAKMGMGMGITSSPNFNDASPEVTRPVKVVRRGGVNDWSAPVV